MKQIQRALEELLEIGYSLGINMVLMGDLSLYMHGIDIKPMVIELIIDEGAIYLFEEKVRKLRFKIVRKMDFYDKGDWYSLSATYMIYGVRVEVHASLTFRHDNYIEKFVLKNILPMCEYRNINKTEVPITSLELELILNMLRNRMEIVEKIIEKFKVNGFKKDNLELMLNELPDYRKNEIKNMLKKFGILL